MPRMPIQPKRRSAAKSTKSTKPATAPSGTSSKPSLRSYHSIELHEKAILVLSTLESARDPTAHRTAFADLAVELTNSGLHYYFIKPLKDAKAGFMLEQSASMGMVGVQQVIGTVIRNIIGRMDGPQLLSVGHSLSRFMQ